MFVIIAVGGIGTAMWCRWRRRTPAISTCSGNLDFIAIISLMAWGHRLRPSPHPGALHGGGLPTTPWPAPSHQHDLDGAYLGGAVSHRFLRPGLLLPTFTEQAGGVTANPGRVLLRKALGSFSALDCRGVLLSRHPGGGHKVPTRLPAAGLLQRITGSLQALPAERLPERAGGVGRAMWCC